MCKRRAINAWRCAVRTGKCCDSGFAAVASSHVQGSRRCWEACLVTWLSFASGTRCVSCRRLLLNDSAIRAIKNNCPGGVLVTRKHLFAASWACGLEVFRVTILRGCVRVAGSPLGSSWGFPRTPSRYLLRNPLRINTGVFFIFDVFMTISVYIGIVRMRSHGVALSLPHRLRAFSLFFLHVLR